MKTDLHSSNPADTLDLVPAADSVPGQSSPHAYAQDVLTGEGMAISRLRVQLSRIAPHFRTAIVTGERGVGKETVARELHRLSGAESSSGPFQSMEMSAFAEQLKPVELRGVLFLKGLDTLEPTLQEKAVQRLRAIQREVRIVVASDCELRIMLATGRLLQSLASRVGTLEIRVAGLRDRMDDVETIATNMMLQLVAPSIAHEAGVRLDRVMQRHVFDVLERCSGNKLRTAELLGISRSTLYRMLDTATEQAAQDANEEAVATIERRVREGVPRERRSAAN
jgi:DNA-binding NtrC family response regulator